METSFNLLDEISKAFGIRPVDTFSNFDTADENVDQLSLLGTPIFMPCTLSYQDASGKTKRIQLPNEPILEISFQKEIIKTVIDSQKGSFKELFAYGDYAVTIRGVIVPEDDTDDYPEELVRQLHELEQLKTAIEIDCKITTIFGIDKIVIESGNIPGGEGFHALQPYQLNCLSDFTFDIELKK